MSESSLVRFSCQHGQFKPHRVEGSHQYSKGCDGWGSEMVIQRSVECATTGDRWPCCDACRPEDRVVVWYEINPSLPNVFVGDE